MKKDKLEKISKIISYGLPLVIMIIGVYFYLGYGDFKSDFEFSEHNFRAVYSALILSLAGFLMFFFENERLRNEIKKLKKKDEKK